MEMTERGRNFGGTVQENGVSQPETDEKLSSGVLLAIYFITVLLPVSIAIGGSRFNPERALLLVLFLPFAIRILSGKVGRPTPVDFAVFGFSILLMAALVYNHGSAELSFGLSQIIEMVGGYMAGRVLIRSANDYQRLIRYFLLTLLILLPLASYELVAGKMIWLEVLSHIGEVPAENGQTRFGLTRAQAVFPQAILYGLFCSLAFASTFYLYKEKLFRLIALLALVIGTTAMSLSSAPILSLVLQSGLLLWGKATKGAYRLLAFLTASIVLALQVFSNRGAVEIFVQTLTLDPQTGWWRILIWQFGSQDVLAHPWFGIGLHDWSRPSWMYSASVDNYWLLTAMRYGIPALTLLMGAFVLHIALAIRARNLGNADRQIRQGYLITIVGLMFVLSTVAVWDILQSFVMFFLGAGAFLYCPEKGENRVHDPAPVATGGRRQLVYSRTPQTLGTRGRASRVSSGKHGYSRRSAKSEGDI